MQRRRARVRYSFHYPCGRLHGCASMKATSETTGRRAAHRCLRVPLEWRRKIFHMSKCLVMRPSEKNDYSRGTRRLLSATEHTTIEAYRYYTKQVEKEQRSSTISPNHYRTAHSLDHKTMSSHKRYSYDTSIGGSPSDICLLTRGCAQPRII